MEKLIDWTARTVIVLAVCFAAIGITDRIVELEYQKAKMDFQISELEWRLCND